MEVVKGQLTGLPIPAPAEIVLEGEIDPSQLKNEGPFGEYTGYYTEELIKPIPKPALDVQRVYFRNNPILWETSVGRPVGDQHMLYAFTRNASLWTDLAKMEIPGIKSVYTLPEGSGRFIVVVSVQQMYPGHADQVGAAVIASNTGTYGIKVIIIVDDDIDADDLPEGLVGARHPLQPGQGHPDHQQGQIDARSIRPSVLMKTSSSPHASSSMQPYPSSGRIKPTEIKLSDGMMAKVKARWSEYGID